MIEQEGEDKEKVAEETPPDETREVATEETPPDEAPKVSLHINMPTEEYEKVKKYAKYATLEGLIEGHPRGNFTDYCNFCFNLGEQYIKRYMLNKRGYK